jgi:hypothetical protein
MSIERKIYRWNGVGPVCTAEGKHIPWPVRHPIMVTEDPKIQGTFGPLVDDRMLEELALDDEAAKEAIEAFEAGTTELAPHTGGGFSNALSGILNSTNVRATAAASNAPATSAPAATADTRPSLDAALAAIEGKADSKAASSAK